MHDESFRVLRSCHILLNWQDSQQNLWRFIVYESSELWRPPYWILSCFDGANKIINFQAKVVLSLKLFFTVVFCINNELVWRFSLMREFDNLGKRRILSDRKFSAPATCACAHSLYICGEHYRFSDTLQKIQFYSKNVSTVVKILSDVTQG